MYLNKKQKFSGFTLIELLVVIAVISLLSSIVLVGLSGVKDRARVAKGLQFSGAVHHALGAYADGVWDFNGDFFDSSGESNNAFNHGATFVSDTPNNVLGQALEFKASENDYIDCGNVNPINAITVQAWVKSESSSGYSGVWQIVSKYSAYILGTSAFNGKNMCFIIYSSGWKYGSCYSVPNPEKWHHFVGTYDSSTGEKKIYVDGDFKDKVDISGTINPDTGPLNIGKRECCANYFSGLIDEVRVYSEVLSSAEIRKHYVEGAEKYGIVLNNF